MHRRHLISARCLPLLLTVVGNSVYAAEVLQQLPADALGFVVVRDIGAADEKLKRLSVSLQLPAPGPLEFVQAATGIGAGLDPHGDFLLAVMPDESNRGQTKFCVWLPVNDYNRLLTSLGSQPAEGISAVRISTEDLLIARRGKWAVVMDPDQRDRLERVLAASGNPTHAVAGWQKWVEASDVTVVALSGGVRELIGMFASNRSQPSPTAASDSAEDLFGDPVAEDRDSPPDAPPPDRPTSSIFARARRAVQGWLAGAPDLVRYARKLQSLGCGLRIDGDGNVVARVRAVGNDPALIDQPAPARSARESGPALYHGGPFIIHGVANLPPSSTAAVATSYVRMKVHELTISERIRLDDRTLARFYDAVGQAAAVSTAACVLTLPGENDDGVYTNSFVAVRVTSADKFVDLVKEALRLWNQMNRDAQGGPRLVFDVEDVSIGNRNATQYSLDLAAADGAPMLPETRQAMEKLFGPGGKLRMLVVKIDDDSAMLAGATAQQAAAVLEQIDRTQAIDWRRPPFAVTNRLLPDHAEWRAFFSPQGYTTWKAREMAAIVGTEVIGGPLVREFPAAPPIGIAGGAEGGELWVEVAVPADTIRGAGVYRLPKRKSRLPR